MIFTLVDPNLEIRAGHFNLHLSPENPPVMSTSNVFQCLVKFEGVLHCLCWITRGILVGRAKKCMAVELEEGEVNYINDRRHHYGP
jgi:hypothetical protein